MLTLKNFGRSLEGSEAPDRRSLDDAELVTSSAGILLRSQPDILQSKIQQSKIQATRWRRSPDGSSGDHSATTTA